MKYHQNRGIGGNAPLLASTQSSVKFKQMALATAVFVLLLYGSAFAIAGFAGDFFGSLSGYFWRTENALKESLGNPLVAMTPKQVLIEKLRSAEEKLQAVEPLMVERENALRENGELKKLLGRQEKNAGTPVLAAILSSPSRSPADTLILDVGKEDGLREIREGDFVLAEGNVFIGRVSKVYSSVSNVELLSSPGLETEVFVAGGEPLRTTATGRGGGNFELKLPRGVVIDKNSSVIFPGVASFVIGVVEDIEAKASDSFNSVIVRTPLNLNAIRWVTIVPGTGGVGGL